MAVPSFIGRSTELQQIKDHWKKACKGQPQVVNLIADTGVGKTRLVQAFYESLSTELKQGAGVSNRSYWPGSLGTDRQRNVNPPRESFTAFDLKNDCIPWLWWGMYWTQDNGENDCALRRFHDSLDVHLSMLELQRNGLRNNLTAVSDTLKDEALDFVTGLIPGGSQALSVFDLAKKLHGHQKAQKEAQKGLASQDKKRNNALANSIIERLQVVFNSKQKGISQVPMVLFLDDIHFATDVSLDGFCLQFLDRLLRQAAQEQWPLLILATHWKGPWQAHRSGVSLEEGKPWRRIVLGIDGAQNDKIPDVHTLELSNMPRDDLHRIANAMLPGLDLEDRVKILARVGNVRWLVEVLIALRENTDNFLNNDRGSSLSAGGHRNLEWLLLSNGYLDVIRKRLRSDAMQDVRFVLGATAWHAHELVFLSPLACAFGEKLVEEKALADSSEPGELVMSVLLRAFDPSALLEGHGQVNQLPLLVRFPERGYLEIAKEMFEPNEHLLPDIRLALGQEIIAWMHEHDDQPPRWQQLEDSVEKKAFLENRRGGASGTTTAA
ncbi:AAA family ATPase [Halomonas sp.]|uniref:AAA family ATPase n=1 Tax=Halomonas sp. TaxID=1486246 RepID=UPI003A8F4CF5